MFFPGTVIDLNLSSSLFLFCLLLTKYYFLCGQNGFVVICYLELYNTCSCSVHNDIQGGSNMTGTDLCVNKPHCAAAVRP